MMHHVLKYVAWGVALVFLVVVALFLLSQFGLITFNYPEISTLW